MKELRTIFFKNSRSKYISDTYLFSLNYADDQVVLAQDAFDLVHRMRKMKQSYSQWGLCVNFKRTKYMAVNSEFPQDHLNTSDTLQISGSEY
jgi:hypothetical protein